MSRSMPDQSPLPLRDGVGASCVAVPRRTAGSVLDFLERRLPGVSREAWARRIAQGEVVAADGRPLQAGDACTDHARLFYYRMLEEEPVLPFEAEVLFQDAHLVVVDKPHFMTVVPSGPYLQRSLLVQMKRRLGMAALSPLHRIDRDTAGLVAFGVRLQERGAYQRLFALHTIEKTYEAVAPWVADLAAPRTHRMRMAPAAEFFREQVVEGTPNTITRTEMLARLGPLALYRLRPTTGRKHQLRVHMAALGAPLLHDPLYPAIVDADAGDYARPLQLLARSLDFTDPVTGGLRHFESRRALAAVEAWEQAGGAAPAP
ncbi:23S rRNA-/tRNA-specific pseudouridylate synthase [Xylophilus ampelinus]|uniref:23S rRNA-/tRNA-specific pseudouridylate synthase n=2 Tax=Xylophilus ampelinus TaxID=54067 RepID=A0A318SV90_9BURK|nr:23S rRNA-/tRNA-specific pseudouridylate synthase [Xylophilus ampelinus]